MRRAVENSLRYLRTDHIDLYYLHRDDEVTALDETIAALGQALADGKIGAWGFSNFRPWKIAQMVCIAERLGVAPPMAGQPGALPTPATASARPPTQLSSNGG